MSTTLTHLIGIIKDKASQSKAALLSRPTTLSLLRATTHNCLTPPTPKHLSTLLSSGQGSRATASTAIRVIIDRLHTTNNSAVALMCLVAIHHIIKHGSFILQDQLSVYPSTGGRNYLNLSNFQHKTNHISWELSSWVRWFAQHIENLLCTSRTLGFFLGNSSPWDREERVSGLTTADLLTEFDSLVTVTEGICKMPNPESSEGNKLVEETVNLVDEDLVETVTEVWVRVAEFGERLGGLQFGESVEVICCLKRMEGCKERMMMTLNDVVGEGDGERLWDLMREVKDKVGKEVLKEESKVNKEVRKVRVSESDRFSRPLLNSADFLRFPSFPSGRLL